MRVNQLEHGQAIKFTLPNGYDGFEYKVMILSTLEPDEETGCTHVVEVLDTNDSFSSPELRERRIAIDANTGQINYYAGPGWEGHLHGVSYESLGYYLPPLPHHKEHKCTDTAFMFVVLLFIGLSYWISDYAYQHGDLENFHHGYDYRGRICGIDVPGKSLVYWCQSTDMTHIEVDYPICVKECPSSRHTTSVCFDPESRQNVTVHDYPTLIFRISPYCWPRNRAWLDQALAAPRSSNTLIGKFLLSLPKNVWAVVPIAAFASFIA